MQDIISIFIYLLEHFTGEFLESFIIILLIFYVVRLLLTFLRGA